MRMLVVISFGVLLLIGQRDVAGQGEEPRRQAVRASEKQALKIEIGQRVDDVQKALRERGVETGPGFAISSKNEDHAHFAYFFDEEQVSAAIFYSKSRRNITGISIVVRQKGRGKGDDVWLAARGITLLPDGSYAVHFEAAKKGE